MPLPREHEYTIKNIYDLSDGQRAELIDGQLYNMAPPTRRHQEIVFALSRKIADYIDANNGDCKVYHAPFAVFLNEDDSTYIEPDISVVCDKNKLTDRGCNSAPDWIIEVVSPSSKRIDYLTKLFKYRNAGVREYWIIDPDKNRIMSYCFEADTVGDYSFNDTVDVGIHDDLSIDFKMIDLD